MKKYSFILLFSFLFFISNVNAEYYLVPDRFSLEKQNNQVIPDFDFYGVNNGSMTNVYTLSGNSDEWYRFELALDGSNCGSNTDSQSCFQTVSAIEDGGLSSTIFGSFSMCVSKPQFHWVVDWSTCNDSCFQKSQDLVVINNSYKNCTLGLYNTETGTNLENDGYLVNVYFDIAKWEYIEGAYSSQVNGRIYLYNDTDSTLYYRFVDNVVISDINMASMNSGFGVFNHDYTNPDVGGETFLNNGTCVQSYNKLNVFSYNNNWNRETETFTFNNNLSFERIPGSYNLLNYNGEDITNSKGYFVSLDANTDYLIQMDGRTIDPPYNGCNLFLFYNGSTPVKYSYVGGSCGNSLKINLSSPVTRVVIYAGESSNTRTVSFDKLMISRGSSRKSYIPYGGYYISYDNLNIDMGVFHYYETNLSKPNQMYAYIEDYEGDTQLLDLVNCRNSYVCKYENYFSFNQELLNMFSPQKDKVKLLKLYFVGSENIYFKNPYLYDLYAVPGHATWKDYYQPYGEYICSDTSNGTFYNAQTKKVYYNPDDPPTIVSSNPNGQSQNIFGIEVDFYGLSSLFSIPIDIYNNIRDGSYNSCNPIVVPFPYFNDQNLTLPCMSTYAYNRFPELLAVYRIIMYGIISVKIGVGTIKYIKKWYDGTIEGGE